MKRLAPQLFDRRFADLMEMGRARLLRQFLADMPEAEAVEFLLRQMKKSKNNAEFFQQMAQG